MEVSVMMGLCGRNAVLRMLVLLKMDPNGFLAIHVYWSNSLGCILVRRIEFWPWGFNFVFALNHDIEGAGKAEAEHSSVKEEFTGVYRICKGLRIQRGGKCTSN